MNLRIYLDTSVYNRPFDDQSQPRIWLESLAFSLILESIEHGDLDLIASSVIEYETSRNPYEVRRRWIHGIIAIARENRLVNEAIRIRAKELEMGGIKSLDALHVATAEAAQADYFVTCDDRLIRRYRAMSLTALVACEPTEMIRRLSPYEER